MQINCTVKIITFVGSKMLTVVFSAVKGSKKNLPSSYSFEIGSN